MTDLRPHEQRRNKNLHCTFDEIDERQTQELSLILDQWEAGELPPEDIMMHITHIVGDLVKTKGTCTLPGVKHGKFTS